MMPAPKSTTEADRMIGNRIAVLRSARGMSQTELGQALGISFQQVQKYEHGRNRISAARIQIIADLMEVPVEVLFNEPNDIKAVRPMRTFLDAPEVTELVLAFAAILDSSARANVLSIVKSTALLHIERNKVVAS